MSATQPPQAWSQGSRASRVVIAQICPIASKFGADEYLFWYAFFTGLAGATCAGIGIPALREMFTELQRTLDSAEFEVGATEIDAKRNTTH